MTNKDYQELKSKIQDACPSLLELTFGCEVEILISKGQFYDIELTNNKEYKKVTYVIGSDNGTKVLFNNGTLKELLVSKIGFENVYEPKTLGHPITLSHVLRAINKTFIEDGECCDFIGISQYGFFLERYYGTDQPIDPKIFWDFSNDSLDWHYENQPETVQFLIDVLLSK